MSGLGWARLGWAGLGWCSGECRDASNALVGLLRARPRGLPPCMPRGCAPHPPEPAPDVCVRLLPISPLAAPVRPCPPSPTVSCGGPPVCNLPGDQVLLVGTCTASPANASVLYVVGGQHATYATCPPAGTPLVVQVQAAYGDLPDCPYNATTAYTLTSRRT